MAHISSITSPSSIVLCIIIVSTINDLLLWKMLIWFSSLNSDSCFQNCIGWEDIAWSTTSLILNWTSLSCSCPVDGIDFWLYVLRASVIQESSWCFFFVLWKNETKSLLFLTKSHIWEAIVAHSQVVWVTWGISLWIVQLDLSINFFPVA